MADKTVSGEVNIAVNVTGDLGAATALDATLASLGGSGGSIEMAGSSAAKASQAFASMTPVVNDAADSFSDWASSTKDWYDQFDKLTGSTNSFANTFGQNVADIADSTKTASSAFMDMGYGAQGAFDAVSSGTPKMWAAGDAFAKVSDQVDDTGGSFSSLTDIMGDVGEAMHGVERGVSMMLMPLFLAREVSSIFTGIGKSIYDAAAIA